MQRFKRQPAQAGSIRTWLLWGFGSILLLNGLSALIGYLSLSRVQAHQAAFQRADRIRQLSLELENAFLQARQEESSFLVRWRVIGFEEAKAGHVTANQAQLAAARARLDTLDGLVAAVDDDSTAQLQAETTALRPLLDTYETAFGRTVAAIDQRSRADGLEQSLQTTTDLLERETGVFADGEFHSLVLQLRASEQAYLNTRQQAQIDSIRLLTRRFLTLAEAGPITTTDGSAPPSVAELTEQIDSFRDVFAQLVYLDTDVALNAVISQDVTSDIRARTNQIGTLTEASLGEAAARVDAINRQSLLALILTATVSIGLAVLAALLLARRIIHPLNQLREAASAIGAGDFNQAVTVAGHDEFMVLAEAFNAMTGQVRTLVGTLEERVHERTAEVEQALVDLRASLAARDELHETIRHLSSPVVPVLDGVLVMPLVGAIDGERSRLLIESLLGAIQHHGAQMAIIDVTGVPVIDEPTALTLVEAAQTAKLLGVRVLLVGLRPEHVQTIVSLGVDLSTLETRADLQSGIRAALNRLGAKNGAGPATRGATPKLVAGALPAQRDTD